MSQVIFWGKRWGMIGWCLLLLQLAGAHPMPNSVVNLSVLDASIRGAAQMPLIELENAVKHSITDLDSAWYRSYFENHMMAYSEGRPWQTTIDSIVRSEDKDPFVGNYEEVTVYFRLTPPGSEYLRRFTFDYDVILHEVVTHQILFFLQYDWSNGMQAEDGASIPLGVIKTDFKVGAVSPLEVDLAEGSWWKGFQGMLLLGMRHIREGLDHLLFLLTLLLIAPLTLNGSRWSDYQGFRYTLFRFLRISFAFTIGHSVTLLVGSLNLLHFRAQYIEILIAVSILLSAVNCWRPIFRKKEVLMAGGFGLVHGLAFSLTLSHLDLGMKGKLLSILGFNLGIECMQLLVMLVFFPLLLLSKWPFYSRLRAIIAVLTMIISVAWIAQRISGQDNGITSWVNALMQ